MTTFVKTVVLALAALGVLLAGCASGNTDPSDQGAADLGASDSAPGDGRLRDLPADLVPGADGKPSDGPPLDSRPPDSRPPDSRPPDSAPPDVSPDSQPPDGAPPDGSGPVAEVCQNGKDDDGDGQVDCVDVADCGAKPPCVDATRTLVLQEVFPGTPDYIVIRNASTAPRNVSGYKLEMHGTGPVSFTLPSRVLGPGQSVHVFEYSDGLSTDIQTGENIPFYNGLVGYENAVVLKSPAGSVIDYVGFGPSLIGLPAGASQQGGAIGYTGYNVSTESHHRAGMKGAWPTFQASDWVVHKKSRQ